VRKNLEEPVLIDPPLARAEKTENLEVAIRYAPRLIFDENEPFLPLAAGFTVFREDTYSPSFPRCIGLAPVGRRPAAFAIEYAIWWDWDITHLYELEHVWTFVDAQGQVCHAEASWHGDFQTLRRSDGQPEIYESTHPVAYAQPGKHAFAGNTRTFEIIHDYARQQCLEQAGSDGVLVTSIFEETLATCKTAENDALANTYLKSRAFEPAFRWSGIVEIGYDHLVAWRKLRQWIPQRVNHILCQLRDASEK